jgi:cytosine/adenosine deaminase-related metal-dependent hydrolase
LTDAPPTADVLLSGGTIVTLNAGRQVIADGAVAIGGDRIVAVGKREALARMVRARQTIDTRRFVITPGFIDGHIHITGDPLTRGLIRGDPGLDWSERLSRWVMPLFCGQTAEDERLSAQCAALAMMRGGTTCFLEAGTVRQLDAVMEGLAETGIRGRVGGWVEGRAFDPAADQAKASADAIAVLESEIARYPQTDGARLAAWPLLVGHSTNSDDVWRAAKTLADEHGLGVSAHMSPYGSDADWFLAHTGRRPLEHLADLGVLGENVALTHLVHIGHGELDILAQTGTNAIHCPVAGVQGGYGLSQIGLFPEMVARGVNVLLGTDGAASDILSSARLMVGLFRDARQDHDLLEPSSALEIAILNGAKALGMQASIGSLEAGKKADLVLHDPELPEWGGPQFDVASQLVFCAPSRGVHSVWIDGVRVIDGGRATLFDQDRLLADARQAGRALVERLGLPIRTTWPVI